MAAKHRLRRLHDATKQIGVMDDEDGIAAAGVRHAAVAYETGSVLLLLSTDGTLEPVACSADIELPTLAGIEHAVIDTACVVNHGRALNVRQLCAGQPNTDCYDEFAFAPLEARDQCIGALGIRTAPTGLELIDLELLCGLASVIAVALTRTRARRSVLAEQRKRLRLSRYFSPQVTTHLLGEHLECFDEGARMDATVLFADIRNFTSYCEGRAPGDILAFLNTYFESVVAPIFDHGGMVDKLLGDGVLAVFGAPLPATDHAIRAARAAIAMIEAAHSLHYPHSGDPVRIGIGLHSGPIIVGDVGGGGFADFTVLGETVNLAARIEGLTKRFDADILMSDATRSQLPATSRCEAMEAQQVRGATGLVCTFDLRGL